VRKAKAMGGGGEWPRQRADEKDAAALAT